jgi:hypothetical protein
MEWQIDTDKDREMADMLHQNHANLYTTDFKLVAIFGKVKMTVNGSQVYIAEQLIGLARLQNCVECHASKKKLCL